MHILYIEDDALDIRNMEWLVDQMNEVQLTVSSTFDSVDSVLKHHTIDFIITDQYINQTHYSDYLSTFEKKNYVVLSNTKNVEKEGLLYPPLQTLQKPLSLDIFKSLFSDNHPTLKAHKNDFFDTISDEGQKKKLIALLSEELDTVLTKLPRLLGENNMDEMKHLIHKVSSKFSLLQMKETFDLAREIEKELDVDVISKEKIKLLLQNTTTALTHLKSK